MFFVMSVATETHACAPNPLSDRLERVETVSYTHLDVYKRQLSTLSNPCSRSDKGVGARLCFSCDRHNKKHSYIPEALYNGNVKQQLIY